MQFFNLLKKTKQYGMREFYILPSLNIVWHETFVFVALHWLFFGVKQTLWEKKKPPKPEPPKMEEEQVVHQFIVFRGNPYPVQSKTVECDLCNHRTELNHLQMRQDVFTCPNCNNVTSYEVVQ